MTASPRPAGRGRSLRRLAAALVVAGAVLVLGVPAGAHPAVTTSVPADGAVLARAPAEVRISFGEDVGAPIGSIRVYDGASSRVDRDDARLVGPDGRTVVATLDQDLPDGAYVVIWRAVGLDDGHLVLGEQHFRVGRDAAAVAAAGSARRDGTADGSGLGRRTGVLGGLAGAATVVVAGTVALAPALLRRRDDRWRPARRGVVALVRCAAGLGVAASLAAVVARAVLLADAYGTAADLRAVAAVVVAPVGIAGVARALLLLPLVAPWLLGQRWLALGASWLALATLAVDGHVGRSAMPVAFVHVAAVALWAGALVALVVALRRAPLTDAAGVVALLRDVSRAATAAVVVAGLAGLALATTSVDGPSGLVAGSGWAQVLRTKTVLATSALLVAAHTRFVLLPAVRTAVRPVPVGAAADATVLAARPSTAGPERQLRHIRRNVAVEVALVGAVLLTSGLLSELDPTPTPTGAAGAAGVAAADAHPSVAPAGAAPADPGGASVRPV